METLRCPTCLGLLLDSEVARCPACHTRFRKGTRPISLSGANGMSGRAHPLLERELEARLEAKTAAGYRQRRRAAKVARRIAALPPTLFESGGGYHGEEEPPAAPSADAGPTIIDLPDEAIHETTTVAPTSGAPVDVVVEVPVEVVDDAPVEAVVEARVEEVEAVVEVEEIVFEAPKIRTRRRNKKAAARVEADAPDILVDEPIAEPVVKVPEPVMVEEVVAPIVEPVVEVPEPVMVAEVVEAVVEPPVERVGEAAPVAPAAGWQLSNSLWKERVFNSVPLRAQNEKVQWPRQWKPVAPLPELDAEPSDELTAESSN